MGKKIKLVHEDLRLTTFADKVQTKLLKEIAGSESDIVAQLEAEILYQKLILSPLMVSSATYSLTQLQGAITPVIILDTTATDVELTLFNSNQELQDGQIHKYWVHHLTGNNEASVIVDGTNFADGLSKLILKPGKTAQLGCMYHPANPSWLRISSISYVAQIRRGASWPAANFLAPAAIPFDINPPDQLGNPDVLSWDLGDPTKLVANFKGMANISYSLSLDSTGGATWNCESWLTVNSVEVPGSRQRTGNFGNEDQSVALPSIDVDLDVGDEVELYIDQNLLTGNLVSATLHAKMEV